MLANKLREIDPEADVALTKKKKIEHMRTAYKREEKKVSFDMVSNSFSCLGNKLEQSLEGYDYDDVLHLFLTDKRIKKTGSGANDVHVPYLWYFDLLKPVFNKHEEYRPGVEKLPNDEEVSRVTYFHQLFHIQL